MIWNEIQTKLKKQGLLRFAMNQSQTDVMTQPGPWGAVKKANGYCAGLAMHWIAKRYADRDFKYDKSTLELDTPSWKATKAQNEMLDNWTGSSITSISVPLSTYGLTLNMGQVTVVERAITGRDLADIGLANEGCHYIYLAGTSGGAHAVAMQREKGHDWRYFDANYGEFKIPDRDRFVEIMDWFLAESKYATTYAMRTRTAGINPPPYVNAKVLADSTTD